jgi:hypothetical protein
MFFWRPRYRYSVVGNVRIETSTMKVYRKYINMKTKEVTWKQVDYKTTHALSEMRVCPPDYVNRVLNTAF